MDFVSAFPPLIRLEGAPYLPHLLVPCQPPMGKAPPLATNRKTSYLSAMDHENNLARAIDGLTALIHSDLEWRKSHEDSVNKHDFQEFTKKLMSQITDFTTA